MASSDEEGEIIPDLVDSYWFENEKEEFVSLSSLTLLWSISETVCGLKAQVFLRGTTDDDGLQTIHKQIIGWRFELPSGKPEISVLSKDKSWITLQRPRKCFESTIKAILVTVYCLHFVKWNPEESQICIWVKMLKAFSSFDIVPSENDLLSNVTLIREAVERDKDLTKSKYLLDFMERACSNEGFHESSQNVLPTKKSKFIVDSEDEENDQSDVLTTKKSKFIVDFEDGENDQSDVLPTKKSKFIVDSKDEENDQSDVHPTKKSKFIVDSEDEENDQSDVLPTKKSKFIGDFEDEKNGQSDVFPTKESKFIVDSEDEENDQSDGELDPDGEQNIGYDTVCAICDNGGEILPCEGRCLRSFHATKEAGIDAVCESLGYTSAQVKAFPNFYCQNCKYKLHQCFACGKLGSSDVSSKAEVFPCVTANCGHYYHPECVARLLSPSIDTEQEEMRKKVAMGKAFVCPLHICSLCKKGENKNFHDLQFAICRRCPKAYHRKCLPREISFVFDNDKSIEQRAWDGLLDHQILIYCLDHVIVRELGTPARDHLVFPDVKVRKKVLNYKLLGNGKNTLNLGQSFEDLHPKKTLVPNLVTKRSVSIQDGDSAKDMEKICLKKDKCFSSGSVKFDRDRKYLKVKNLSVLNSSLQRPAKKLPLKIANLSCNSRLREDKSLQKKMVDGSIGKTGIEKPLKKIQTSLDANNAEMENSILSLMKDTMSTFNEEEFKKNHQAFSTTSGFTEPVSHHKNLTQGKVEGSVKAIQTALQRLEEGGSIEEAKAICDPGVLHQLFIWQKQLKVYLSPFLHGMRYTSFGRHFTKIDKLKEVANRLHWYVQNGDTVLDFCCGSNDFSRLMKSKLEEMGKSCSFKNYDLFQPKNDFNFEKRDWMSVNAEELPNGSQLIIGLNPPFGVKGSLANKFINKALTFKPKLLILIVPKVTKRLDRKKEGYDLIWEDDEMLSGKSFYLPGSVDTRDKQLEDWNLKPPPLYLWSRPDWTTKHREIAQKHCHIKEEYDVHVNGKEVKNYLMEENHECYQNCRGLHVPGNVLSIFDGIPNDNGANAPEEGATSNASVW
ncbi:protein ENHANCED DOWNY MILDEW 2 isoform X4 [Glycine max]|nr:protein ENHANCED DOWNY MILDEW 2 isoform X4 [Glycine max]XP_014629167.1 protein ENHANCED DOWNY MILDEW 2 isoform X4 [Glycine max]XP_040869892.1 protein ENHANCED DOWNY MILDEW 2 isoform X4 [Glycine max]XP_040869893.1 protein ENHANCED DOWNY MILDEW 2 isoform X4 [Glycine max]|eukprot:XP_006576690.1 protein ENHANCED DOWNY MILDEW 2 isoform X4 [Glycine max]